MHLKKGGFYNKPPLKYNVNYINKNYYLSNF